MKGIQHICHVPKDILKIIRSLKITGYKNRDQYLRLIMSGSAQKGDCHHYLPQMLICRGAQAFSQTYISY